jgi:hypothetical protein
VFRERMLRIWQSHRYNRDDVVRAAKLGAEALWCKYRTDPDFKRRLDLKLRDSRARGGSISLRNLGEVGFKARLRESGPKQVRPQHRDVKGNLLRSRFEVQVANLLASHDIEYKFEARFVVGDHAFYPDFLVGKDERRIVEVVGYMGDRYWGGTAKKIRLIASAYPRVEIAVVTSFVKIMKRRLHGLRRVSIFRPYQEEELVRWCRGGCRGS